MSQPPPPPGLPPASGPRPATSPPSPPPSPPPAPLPAPLPLPADLPADWPNRAASRRIDVAPHRWHVQIMGAGPTVLMLHGAGASGHSFRALMALMAPRFRLIVPDLPGQGFTRAGSASRLGLQPMAQDLAQLCADQGWVPDVILGHSAGAAIALELARILPRPPCAIVGINPALSHFRGVAGWLFPLMARLLMLNPFVPHVFARSGRRTSQVIRILGATGSTLTPEGVELYRRLMGDAGHVQATLAMMAQWRLDPLLAALPEIAVPCLFVVGAGDSAVPPDTALGASTRLPSAEVRRLEGYGHLIHEEAPVACADLIVPWLADRVAAQGQGVAGGAGIGRA